MSLHPSGNMEDIGGDADLSGSGTDFVIRLAGDQKIVEGVTLVQGVQVGKHLGTGLQVLLLSGSESVTQSSEHAQMILRKRISSVLMLQYISNF